MTRIAIIQARMGSSRLPGKTLEMIEGHTMLERVVRRARLAGLVDEVIVATTRAEADEAIVEECAFLDVDCHRGSEEDVLDRYLRAARTKSADTIIRVTSDCPLLDPEVADTVIRSFLDEGVDYASNTLDRTFPRGLDVEVFSRDALERAAREAAEPYQREHVTPFIWENPGLFRVYSVVHDEDLSHLRWTVDTSEDLALIRAIYRRLEPDDSFSWRTVAELVLGDSELQRINAEVRQKSLRSDST